MPAIELTVKNAVGLHARPASLFVKTASRFTKCELTLQNITAGTPAVNAKSILKVLTQGVQQGQQIRVEANGDEAGEALLAIQELVDSNFGEN